jgi:Flp pilus assembly protein TadG
MRRHLRAAIRRLRRSEGANLIEAAIVLPALVLVTFATIDFAVVLFAYLALQNGVSQATRYAVTGNVNPGSTREASIRSAMRQSTPTLTIADADITFSHMPIGGGSWSGGTGAPGTIEKVTVNYTWHIISPLIRPFFTNGQIRLQAESAMKNEPPFP